MEQGRRESRLHASKRKREGSRQQRQEEELPGPEGHSASVLGRGSLCWREQSPGQFIVYFITLGYWALGQGSYFRQRS